MKLLLIFIPIALIIFFNKLFLFSLGKKKLVFTHYLFFFIKFTSIILLIYLILFYVFKLQYDLNSNFFISIIIVYFLLFMCTFLIICTKFTSSPTEIIYSYIKKNQKTNLFKLKKYIKKKGIISSRFIDLKNQKLIFEKKNYIFLTEFGKNFIKYFVFIKNFFKVKCEG